MRRGKVLELILAGGNVANIPFVNLCGLLLRLGFVERVRGGHHIFTRVDIPEIINLQSVGGKAKPYQVRQVRDVLLKYGFGGTAK